MKKPLLETFDNLNLTDRQTKLFRDVMVSRIVVCFPLSTARIELVISSLVSFAACALLAASSPI